MAASPIRTPKKLIAVALLLDAVNVAAAREKSICHGATPATSICGGHCGAGGDLCVDGE